MLRTPSVDRRFFQATADAIAGMGLDIDQLCRAERLINPLLIEGERLPLEHVSRLYLAVARAVGDPAFIYLHPGQVRHEQSSVLFALVMCCRTPADMVRTICRYSSIATDAVRYELLDDSLSTVIRVMPETSVLVTLHQVEVAVWFLVQWHRQLHAAAGIQLDCRVRYAHAPLFDEARYRQLYATPLSFQAERTEVIFSGRLLNHPIEGHDARMQAFLQAQAERYEQATLSRGDFIRRVAILLTQRMAFGKPDAGDVAAQLNISMRTLQRRLQHEGSTWSQVADEARKIVACRELQQAGRPLSEIAMLTGFSDVRAFLRAFRRWTGSTPARYRAEVHSEKN